MKIPFLDLSELHQALNIPLSLAFERVLKSGWFVMGPELESVYFCISKKSSAEDKRSWTWMQEITQRLNRLKIKNRSNSVIYKTN